MNKDLNNYRLDIDGVRALAVISVILYHLEFTYGENVLFTGGFTGVDVFFVISGYLITNLLYKEYTQNKNINIKNFFIRRARRLLPMLFFLLIIVFVFSYFFILPSFWNDISKTSLAITLFSANFYFLTNNFDYGLVTSNLNPLLHLWSLSVEEQFYLFFPFFLIFLLKKKFDLLKIIFSLIIISFFFSLILEKLTYKFDQIENFVFYSPFTRAWELLLGCLLSIIKEKEVSKKFISNFFQILGVFLIIYSLFFSKFNNGMLALEVLPAVIGTSILIIYGRNKGFINSLLTTKLLRSLGLYSYSAYLVHFPIISFSILLSVNEQSIIDNVYYKFFILMITFFISSLTYKYVETPFRSNKFDKKKFIKIIFLSFFLIFLSNLIIFQNNGYKKRFNNFFSMFSSYRFNNDSLRDIWSSTHGRFTSVKLKKIEKGKKNFIIIGDSFAVDYFNLLDSSSSLKNNFILYRQGIKDFIKYSDQNPYFKEIEIVIFGGRFNYSPDNSYNYDNELKNLYDEINLLNEFLKKNDKKLMVILNKPEFGLKSYKKYNGIIYEDYIRLKNNYTLLDFYLHDYVINKKKITNDVQRKLEEIHFENLLNPKLKINSDVREFLISQDINFLDPMDYTCNLINKKCEVFTDKNEKIYWDYGHYTLEGAKYFGKKIKKLNWFKTN